MTAPIDIEKVFPSFELLTAGMSDPDADTGAAEAQASLDATAPAATASLTSGVVSGVAVDTAGSLFTTAPVVTVAAPAGGAAAQTNSSIDIIVAGADVANTKTLTVGGTAISFGDVASGAGDIKTDIVGTSAVPEAKAKVIIDYSGHHSSLNNGCTVTIGSDTLTEGVDFNKGADSDAFSTNLTAAIDALTDVTASENKVSPSQYLITVEAVTAGAAGNSIASTTSFTSHISIPTATLEGGVTAVAVGDAKDDLAASIASYIRGTITGFSAENTGNTITISYTDTNGTDPASPVGDTKTVSTDAPAKFTIPAGGALTSGSVEKRQATATAALYAATDSANRGTIESIAVVDAGSGYASAPDVTIPSAGLNKNVIEKIAKLGADMVTGGGTFAYTKDYIAIALEDLHVGSAQLLTTSETAEDTGDFRKLTYHYLRAIQEYLDAQEGVDTVAVAGTQAGYAGTDTATVSGGGGSGATVSLTIVAGVITAVAVDTPGSGYTSDPSVVVTTTTGTGATFTVNRTTNTPAKFDVTKGFLTENASNYEVTRDWTATFTFDESGLEMANES